MEDRKELESILWEKIKDGDITALGELYDQYIDILFSYGMQLSNNKGHVMNCIHDLFIDIYKYRSSLAKTDNVKNYLFKSLKRKIYKKVTHKLVFSKEKQLTKKNIAQKNYTKSFEEDLIASEHVSERSLKLSEAINSLTKKQRLALYLRFTEDRPYEEIAEHLNISIQSTRTTIYRAIKTLRIRLTSFVFFVLFICFY